MLPGSSDAVAAEAPGNGSQWLSGSNWNSWKASSASSSAVSGQNEPSVTRTVPLAQITPTP